MEIGYWILEFPAHIQNVYNGVPLNNEIMGRDICILFLGIMKKVLLVCIFLVGCVSTEYNVATHRQDFFFYSSEKEIAIGRSIAKQVAKEYIISQNPFYINRVKEIGKKIADVCDRQELTYYFEVLEPKKEKDENMINAFALPGGYIYIFKDLVDVLETDDELAFVLAHEVGHIVARHSIKKLQALMGYNLVMAGASQAKTSDDLGTGLTLSMMQILSAYSREDELNADELGAKYLKTLGYDPAAGIDVLEKLYQENKKRPRQPLMYFRTHPHAAQRIGKVKEALDMPLSISDYMNE